MSYNFMCWGLLDSVFVIAVATFTLWVHYCSACMVLMFLPSNCSRFVPGCELHFTVVNCYSSLQIISNIQTHTTVIWPAPSMLAKRVNEMHGSGEREHQPDVVLLAHPMENDHSRQFSVHWLCELIPVVHISSWRGCCAPTTTNSSCLPI